MEIKWGFIIGSIIFIGLIVAGFLIFSPRFTGNIVLSVEDVSFEVSGDTVKVENFAFLPKNLVVEIGTTVEWVNLDSVRHTVTSVEEGMMNSILLSQGETYSYTFNEVGEFDYYCVPHPYMVGTVVVE